MDLPLLQWLETYTFPMEAKFKDSAFARKVRHESIIFSRVLPTSIVLVTQLYLLLRNPV